MRILDRYILKRYLVTFFFTLIILIPIAVAIDVSEKIDKFLIRADLSLKQIITDHYVNFIIYYGNTFMPLALFIAVILFTSKLSSNTEIIAITSARVSFTRFLYPYFIGATLVTIFSLVMNHLIVPKSNKKMKAFHSEYLSRSRNKYKESSIRDFSFQLNDSTYVYFRTFNLRTNSGSNFTIESYDGIKLKSKLMSDNISWNPKDSTYKLLSYKYRKIGLKKDSIDYGPTKDTILSFVPSEMKYKSTLSQEMPSPELSEFINLSQKRGVKNLNAYLVEYYKRTSLPLSSYVLTIIAVALAYKKRRGGIGVNLAFGIGVMFIYVFFLKVVEVLGAVADANPLIYVWIPNILFGGLALYLYYNAKK